MPSDDDQADAKDAAVWPALPCRPALEEGEAHVVRIALLPPNLPGELLLLSTDEHARATRLAFEVHRRRFVAARAALRRILAAYLDTEPSSLRFSYSARGRPGLATPGGPAFDFNLAHSEDLALLALSRVPVGVDVEHLRQIADADRIAWHFFSTREIADLERLPLVSRVRGFFWAWTRKEALLKASGLGLAALREVAVSLDPDRPPRVLFAPDGLAGWRLFHLEPGPEFVGALAVSGPVSRLRHWEWHWPGPDPHRVA